MAAVVVALGALGSVQCFGERFSVGNSLSDAGPASGGAAGEGTGGSVDPVGGGAGMMECSGCGGDRPACDDRTGNCVECTGDPHCGGDRPACDAESNTCVPCTDNAHCTNPAVPLCSPTTNTCVRCLENSQCASGEASRCEDGQCVPCVQHDDCKHVEGMWACFEGACVQCTGSEFSCGTQGETGHAYVCDATSRTCSSEAVQHGADLCEPCISDANCRPGQVCARQRFGAAGTPVGDFCFQRQSEAPDGQCGLATRPYPAAVEVLTLEGEVVTVCAPAETTCVALNAVGTSCTSPDGEPDDSLCGATPPGDGSCVSVAADEGRCVSACSYDEDCASGVTCERLEGYCGGQP